MSDFSDFMEQMGFGNDEDSTEKLLDWINSVGGDRYYSPDGNISDEDIDDLQD